MEHRHLVGHAAVTLPLHPSRPLISPPPALSVFSTSPLTADWVVGIGDPQLQCMMVNAWTMLMVNVALPLALSWQLERRARRRLQLQRERGAVSRAAAGAEERPSGSGGTPVAPAARRLQLPHTPGAWALNGSFVSAGVWAAICAWASLHGAA